MFAFRALVSRNFKPIVQQHLRWKYCPNRIRKEPAERPNQMRNAVMRTRKARLMYHRARSHEALVYAETHRSELLEWNLRSEIFAFGKRLGEDMSEKNLTIAFSDPSYVDKELEKREELGMTDVPIVVTSNVQLANTGEQLILTFISKYLRFFLPFLPEEGIRAVRDYLVADENLADMAKMLGVYDIVLCEPKFPSDEVLAQCLKAVVGVLVEEKGAKHAEKFVIDFILTYLHDKHIFELWNIENPHEVLSGILSNEAQPNYEPRLLHSTAMHTIEACFEVGVFVNKELIGSGSGETIEVAHEMAVYDALARKFKIKPNEFIFKFGVKSYDLNYDACQSENLSLDSWANISPKQVDATTLDG